MSSRACGGIRRQEEEPREHSGEPEASCCCWRGPRQLQTRLTHHLHVSSLCQGLEGRRASHGQTPIRSPGPQSHLTASTTPSRSDVKDRGGRLSVISGAGKQPGIQHKRHLLPTNPL